jgi:hypothetical protein
VKLYGAALLQEDGTSVAPQGQTLTPGATHIVRLFWEAEEFIHTDYTVFVHLIGPDGTPLVQADSRPLNGFIPTSYWPPRQQIADDHSFTLPADAPPGEYRLVVGWYDLANLQRLPMTQDGAAGGGALGDAYTVATFTVGE